MRVLEIVLENGSVTRLLLANDNRPAPEMTRRTMREWLTAAARELEAGRAIPARWFLAR